MALLTATCSLANLDDLRDSTCAPRCGADAAADADAARPDAGADGGPAPAGCGPDAGYHALVMCDRPQAYWRLGEAASPTAFDEIDGGPFGAYIATADGGITYAVTGAIAGDGDTAIHLDGSGHVRAGTALGFPGNAPYSIEAWVSPDAVDFNYRRIVQRVLSDPQGAQLEGYVVYNQQACAAERYSDGGRVQAEGSVLGTLGYTHLVVTFDGVALRVFQDGIATSKAPAEAPLATVAATFFIGGNDSNGAGWIGRIDEVAVYAYALSEAQIRVHHRAGRGM